MIDLQYTQWIDRLNISDGLEFWLSPIISHRWSYRSTFYLVLRWWFSMIVKLCEISQASMHNYKYVLSRFVLLILLTWIFRPSHENCHQLMYVFDELAISQLVVEFYIHECAYCTFSFGESSAWSATDRQAEHTYMLSCMLITFLSLIDEKSKELSKSAAIQTLFTNLDILFIF